MGRRRFHREFKVSAVQLVHQQGYSVTEAARSLGVDPASLRSWVKRYGADSQAAVSGEGALKAELRRLHYIEDGRERLTHQRETDPAEQKRFQEKMKGMMKMLAPV